MYSPVGVDKSRIWVTWFVSIMYIYIILLFQCHSANEICLWSVTQLSPGLLLVYSEPLLELQKVAFPRGWSPLGDPQLGKGRVGGSKRLLSSWLGISLEPTTPSSPVRRRNFGCSVFSSLYHSSISKLFSPNKSFLVHIPSIRSTHPKCLNPYGSPSKFYSWNSSS